MRRDDEAPSSETKREEDARKSLLVRDARVVWCHGRRGSCVRGMRESERGGEGASSLLVGFDAPTLSSCQQLRATAGRAQLPSTPSCAARATARRRPQPLHLVLLAHAVISATASSRCRAQACTVGPSATRSSRLARLLSRAFIAQAAMLSRRPHDSAASSRCAGTGIARASQEQRSSEPTT